MRTLVVGDVHGCAAELAELLSRAGADRTILVGDLFTKGPDAAGVWALIQEAGAQAVMGNHDLFVLDRWRQGDLRAPLAALRWAEELPLWREEDGFVVIHAGLNPVAGLAGTDAQMATTLRRWPDDSDPGYPFWWELYGGDRLVLYGHDARRGLRDNRPSTLGLDTGCVYGGALTGYLVEEDRILSVPARRAYKAVGGKGTA